jgi:hypothetical protein
MVKKPFNKILEEIASVDPWKTRDIKMPSWQYAGRIWYR